MQESTLAGRTVRQENGRIEATRIVIFNLSSKNRQNHASGQSAAWIRILKHAQCRLSSKCSCFPSFFTRLALYHFWLTAGAREASAQCGICFKTAYLTSSQFGVLFLVSRSILKLTDPPKPPDAHATQHLREALTHARTSRAAELASGPRARWNRPESTSGSRIGPQRSSTKMPHWAA